MATKAELEARVAELEAALEGGTVLDAVTRLGANAGPLSDVQRTALAAAQRLATAMDLGPDLPLAGISKQLEALVQVIAPPVDAVEGPSFLNELQQRRVAKGVG